MVSVRPAAAQVWNLQALDRSAAFRRGARCRGALPDTTHARPGSLRGREIPDSGARAHAATATALAPSGGAAHSHLCPARYSQLFAARNVKAETAIGQCYLHHRSSELWCFLDEIETAVPADPKVYVVIDNSAAHKTNLIRARLPNNRAITCTSRRHPPRGSTRPRGGSAS